MAAIKRFFEKRKLDVKFKKAGGGHRLDDDSSNNQPVPSPSYVGPERPRVTMSSSQQRAAEAAMSRMSSSGPKGPALGTSAASVKMQAKREIEAEQAKIAKAQKEAEAYAPTKEVHLDGFSMLAVDGVFFKCALAGDKSLPKKEMEVFIHEFLMSQLPEEPEMTSALMIHTLNKDPDKCKVAIDTLVKYIDNVVAHPGEEKFRKIRINNKAFQERVAKLEGTHEFLQAAGFEQKMLPGPNEVEEPFLVMDEERSKDPEKISTLKEILLCAEPIKPELDHNVKVYYPSPYAQRMELPPDFFNISTEELKKEQQARQEATEKLGMLRTKEMRERDRIRELRRYRYSLMRVRFPDGVLLQGTFKAHDKFESVIDFIRDCLDVDWIPFEVSTSTGQKLSGEGNQTLAELGLAPAAILNFQFDTTVLAEMAAQQGSSQIDRYLKVDLMSTIQAL